MDTLESPVYSKSVLEFVTVANQFCLFLESSEEMELKDFVNTAHKVLPFLYMKATLLPNLDNSFDEFNEKYVTESDYNLLHSQLLLKFGKFDFYQEVFDPLRDQYDEPADSSLAENIADIYQDIKDCVLLYQIGTEEVMQNAIWECRQSFERYWGQKLVNALRALHHLMYAVVDLTSDENNSAPGCEIDDEDGDSRDTSNWFISKRMEDFNDEK